MKWKIYVQLDRALSNYIEDIQAIRKFLEEQGTHAQGLKNWEIYMIWEIFSDRHAASWLIPSKEQLEEFKEWLE